jgi:hypothetical protein
MDALALLCTLHADGPSTLQRLKAAGCHSLADLARLSDERLVELVESTPAAARRFRREARHLAERAGADWLEREEGSEESLPLAAQTASAEQPQTMHLPPRERSILDKVLAQWREADAREPLPATAEEEPMSVEGLVLESLESTESCSGTPLEAGCVEGLDEQVLAALANCGVDTLEAFEAAELDQLALHSGVGYSRLDRVRRLLYRAEFLPVGTPASSEPERMIVPRAPAAATRRAEPWTPAPEGAAGPFA